MLSPSMVAISVSIETSMVQTKREFAKHYMEIGGEFCVCL